MIRSFLLSAQHSIQVLPLIPGAVDAHGNPKRIYRDPRLVPVYAIAPAGATEQAVLGRDWATTSTWDIYAPEGTLLSAYDRVILPGDIECEVLGEPRSWVQTGFPNLLQVGGVHFIVQRKAG